MAYDYFKRFSSPKRLENLFICSQEGKKRFIFVFDEGEFCETAAMLGYSAIYISNGDELSAVTEVMSKHSFLLRENIIFPLCGKEITKTLAAAMDSTANLVTMAWKQFYAGEKTREFYRLRPDELKKAITGLADTYTVKSEAHGITPKCFDEVEEIPIDWLWEPYIAKGCITIIFAEPGAGKTFFTCWLASRLSKGDPLPGALPAEWKTPEVCRTIFLNSEDSESYTLKPRLIGCGADLKNVFCVPSEDCARLDFFSEEIEKTVKDIRPDMVVFDPMQSFMGSGIDMNRANQTRPVLAHLAALASKYSFAAVLVCHSNKSVMNGGNNRLMGSQDIKGAARSVIFLGVHPRIPEIKAVFQIKNNLGQLGEKLAFKTVETPMGTAFEHDPTEQLDGLSFEDCMDTSGKCSVRRAGSQKQHAEEVIAGLFKNKDRYTTAEMRAAAANEGIGWSTFLKSLREITDFHRISYQHSENYYTIKVDYNI